jgi:signal transduction histidine kinase
MKAEEGVLRVTGEAVERDGAQWVDIRFEDNGCGMSPAHCARVFEPFFSTKAPGSEAGGTGLGLSISHSIIEKHGGTLSVQSEEGKGSVFTVSLPAARGEAAYQARSSA